MTAAQRMAGGELIAHRERGERELQSLRMALLDLVGPGAIPRAALLELVREDWGACEAPELKLVLAELVEDGAIRRVRGGYRRRTA